MVRWYSGWTGDILLPSARHAEGEKRCAAPKPHCFQPMTLNNWNNSHFRAFGGAMAHATWA